MQVRRLTQALRAGQYPTAELVGSVTLTYDDRHRRRMRLTTDQGEPVLLDLAKPFPLAGGDALMFEGGGLVEVRAAAEDILEVAGEDAHHLARLAWHLGNRHVPTAILDGHLRIRYDHVLETMLARLGARCARARAREIFQPERGAYASHGPRHG